MLKRDEKIFEILGSSWLAEVEVVEVGCKVGSGVTGIITGVSVGVVSGSVEIVVVAEVVESVVVEVVEIVVVSIQNSGFSLQLTSHLGPENPSEQLHVNPFTPSIQTPLF